GTAGPRSLPWAPSLSPPRRSDSFSSHAVASPLLESRYGSRGGAPRPPKWPRMVPAPPADWINGKGRYSYASESVLLPVKTLGPGAAVNVRGTITFPDGSGGAQQILPTSLAVGETVDMQVRWVARIAPPATVWETRPAVLRTTMSGGGLWQTSFSIFREGD